jgi:hypothetical protein
LASWTMPLHLSLSAAMFLHPLTPITLRSAVTLSIHLFLGLPFFLLECSLPLSILLGNWDSGSLSRCPNHLSLCVFMNLTRSCPLISSLSSWLYRILQPSWSCTGPYILRRIFRSKDLCVYTAVIRLTRDASLKSLKLYYKQCLHALRR